MMNTRLERSQLERIETWYHDHPLLIACQSAFRSYQAGMRYLMFSPIEVFVEAIDVLDDLLEEGNDVMDYIHNLWENRIIRYKLWYVGAPQDDEFHTAVSSVCYAVAVALSRHEDTYYSETVKDAILDEIAAHTNIIKQDEDKILVSLSLYADEIDTWMKEYIKRDGYLSDDILDVANGKKPKPWKTTTQKTSKNHCSKKKTVKLDVGIKDYSRYSFKIAEELKLWDFYHLLTKHEKGKMAYIDDMKEHVQNLQTALGISKTELEHETDIEINVNLFRKVFSGTETDVRIVWRRDANELLYLIDSMQKYYIEVTRNGKTQCVPLLRSPQGIGIWELTHFRFMNGKPRKELDERTGKMVDVFTPIEFKDDAFSHQNYPKKKSCEAIDDIISKIAPPRAESISEEIQTQMNSLGNFEERDNNLDGNYNNDTDEQLARLSDEGHFRDTTHKGKYQ